jgi:hypothetical protein
MKEGSSAPTIRVMNPLQAAWLALGGFFPIVVAIHAVSGLFLMRLVPHHMTTDTPSYISVARSYAEGRFHDAVNWVWSPLISWLMAPLIRVGMDPISALHLLALATGFAGLIVCRGMFRELGIPERMQSIMLLALVPVFHAFSLVNPNPDFLVAVILLGYLRVVLSSHYGKSPRSGFFCGLLGALAYLAKAYAFPFFVVHFPLVSLCRHIRERDPVLRRNLRFSLCLGLAAFILVSSAWIGVLYAKYNRLTISTIGSYNFRLVNDESGLSFLYDGFAEPPGPSALSAWEDPTRLAEGRLKPLELSRMIESTMRRTGKNVLKTIEGYQAGSVFSMAILFCAAMGLIGLSTRAVLGNAFFLILLTILLLPAGYLPLLVDRRYLYLGILLIYALGGSLLLRVDAWDQRQKTAAIVVLCLSFTVVPLRDLRANMHLNDEVHAMASVLVDKGMGGRIASNGSYDRSLFLAYFIAGTERGATYLGSSPPDASGAELKDGLRRYGIDSYLCWAEHPCNLPPGYPVLQPGGTETLRVYRIR